MSRPPRLTEPSLRVLRHMLDTPGAEYYGFELMDACKIASGTLYRILARFRDARWLDWRVEDIDPAVEGRPARTYYHLSPDGIAYARSALEGLGWADGSAGAFA